MSRDLRDEFEARVQEGLNAAVGPPDDCERPVGHAGPCGWFLSADEREGAILNGRCGAQHETLRGVIRA